MFIFKEKITVVNLKILNEINQVFLEIFFIDVKSQNRKILQKKRIINFQCYYVLRFLIFIFF